LWYIYSRKQQKDWKLVYLRYCRILYFLNIAPFFFFSFMVYIFPIQDSNYHEEPVVGKWLSEIYNTVLDTSNLSIRSGLSSPIQVKKMLNVSQISWDIVITSMLTTMGSCCVVGTNEDFINRVLIFFAKKFWLLFHFIRKIYLGYWLIDHLFTGSATVYLLEIRSKRFYWRSLPAGNFIFLVKCWLS
jgi:hypothetical protein